MRMMTISRRRGSVLLPVITTMAQPMILPSTLLLATVAPTLMALAGLFFERSRIFSAAHSRGSTRGWEGRRRCMSADPTRSGRGAAAERDDPILDPPPGRGAHHVVVVGGGAEDATLRAGDDAEVQL